MKVDDLLDTCWRPDPYPLYKALREQSAIHFSERLNGWILTRHADASAALRNPRLSSKRSAANFTGLKDSFAEAAAPFKQSLEMWPLFRDPPDHTRIRALLSKAFVPRLIESIRPKIRNIVEQLLDLAAARGSLELVADLAYPLPTIVIAELLGVPPEDRDLFRVFSSDIASLIAPGIKNLKVLTSALESWQRIDQYLTSLIGSRRSAPCDDLMSGLLSAEEKGVLLSEVEVKAALTQLLFAGHETTINLISNSVLVLLNHPEARPVLQDPERMPTLVEELLRYEAPVQIVTRLALEDMELAAQEVHQGQRVILLLASANRDAEVFPEPDTFRADRSDNRHLSFGGGVHFCLGSALARAEAQIALGLLFERWPEMRLSEENIRWQDNLSFRCPERLGLAFK